MIMDPDYEHGSNNGQHFQLSSPSQIMAVAAALPSPLHALHCDYDDGLGHHEDDDNGNDNDTCSSSAAQQHHDPIPCSSSSKQSPIRSATLLDSGACELHRHGPCGEEGKRRRGAHDEDGEESDPSLRSRAKNMPVVTRRTSRRVVAKAMKRAKAAASSSSSPDLEEDDEVVDCDGDNTDSCADSADAGNIAAPPALTTSSNGGGKAEDYGDHGDEPASSSTAEEGGGSSTGTTEAGTSFPRKLHEMLDAAEREGFQHIVSWLPGNLSFRVHDNKAFAAEIIPKYLSSMTKYKSFVRQLNLYCFTRINKGQHRGSYHHPQFVRGKRHLTSGMGPKKCKGGLARPLMMKRSSVDHSGSDPLQLHADISTEQSHDRNVINIDAGTKIPSSSTPRLPPPLAPSAPSITIYITHQEQDSNSRKYKHEKGDVSTMPTRGRSSRGSSLEIQCRPSSSLRRDSGDDVGGTIEARPRRGRGVTVAVSPMASSSSTAQNRKKGKIMPIRFPSSLSSSSSPSSPVVSLPKQQNQIESTTSQPMMVKKRSAIEGDQLWFEGRPFYFLDPDNTRYGARRSRTSPMPSSSSAADQQERRRKMRHAVHRKRGGGGGDDADSTAIGRNDLPMHRKRRNDEDWHDKDETKKRKVQGFRSPPYYGSPVGNSSRTTETTNESRKRIEHERVDKRNDPATKRYDSRHDRGGVYPPSTYQYDRDRPGSAWYEEYHDRNSHPHSSSSSRYQYSYPRYPDPYHATQLSNDRSYQTGPPPPLPPPVMTVRYNDQRHPSASSSSAASYDPYAYYRDPQRQHGHRRHGEGSNGGVMGKEKRRADDASSYHSLTAPQSKEKRGQQSEINNHGDHAKAMASSSPSARTNSASQQHAEYHRHSSSPSAPPITA